MAQIVDVPANWRRASLGPTHTVSLESLKAASILPEERSVFVQWKNKDEVILIRNWLAENISDDTPVTVHSRYQWESRQFETTKTFLGLTFEFGNNSDLINFKLRWLD